MALNQILNATDEVIDGSPRYNITDNGDGTKSIELANEIVQEGTAINRNIFNSIDNVLSYLTPSVEKTEQQALVEGASISNSSGNEVSVGETVNGTIKFGSQGTNKNATFYVPNNNSNAKMTPNNIYKMNSTDAAFRISPRLSSYVPGTSKFIITLDTPIFIKSIGASTDGPVSYMTTTIKLYNNDISIGTNTQTSSCDLVLNDFTECNKIEISYSNSTASSHYGYIHSINFKDYSLTYQNQFTLDNNGTTFVNNQRILVETPSLPPIPTPTTTATLMLKSSSENQSRYNVYNANLSAMQDGLIPSIEYKFYSLTIGGTEYTSWNETQLDTLFARTTTASYSDNRISFYQEQQSYVIVDFKTPRTFSITYLAGSGNGKIAISNDGLTWQDVKSISDSSSIQAYTNSVLSRYCKIYGTSSLNLSVLYFTNISDTKIETPTEYGVSSNTINDITCDTILQPSTKYELIYNASNNKFELGGLKTLFDITLSEAVNQVNLTGISDMLEEGKLYALIITNNDTMFGVVSSNDTLFFGGGSLGSWNSQGGCNSPIIFSTSYEWYTGIHGKIASWYINNNQCNTDFVTPHEYIKCNTVSTKLLAGTRIIIKEVA